MHKRRCELPGFLCFFFSFLVWYCLKHISACKFGFIKYLTETVNFLFRHLSLCCCHTHRWHFVHLFVISPYFCDFIFYVICTVDGNYCCRFNALIITLTVRQDYFLWDLNSLQPCCLRLTSSGVWRCVQDWRWRRQDPSFRLQTWRHTSEDSSLQNYFLLLSLTQIWGCTSTPPYAFMACTGLHFILRNCCRLFATKTIK
jgi:hypothetical protein